MIPPAPPPGSRTANAVQLSSLKAGRIAVVRQITGGRSIAQRLASLGLLPGQSLRVVRNWGPLIVEIRDNRLALGRSAAQHVLVDAGAERAS